METQIIKKPAGGGSASGGKILFVITKSNWGGAQRYVYDLATNLPKEQFEVGVAFGQTGLLAKKLDAVQVTAYPILSLQRDISIIADVRSFFELLRLFRAKKFDIVHLNSSKAAGIGALAARLAGVPKIIFTAHGWPFEERRNIVWRTFAYLGSWMAGILSRAVIVVSEHDLQIARRMPFVTKKVHLIYNGIGPLDSGTGETIRNAFPRGAHITGTIGELTHNKNQIELIEKAKQDPGMYVAIVGEGEDRESLQRSIDESRLTSRVKLFGFVPAHDALRGFDEFVLPSLKEGLPYVLLEAQAAGLPIFANLVGGVREILERKSDFSLDRMVSQTIALYR